MAYLVAYARGIPASTAWLTACHRRPSPTHPPTHIAARRYGRHWSLEAEMWAGWVQPYGGGIFKLVPLDPDHTAEIVLLQASSLEGGAQS